MCPQGCGGSSPPFGTTENQALPTTCSPDSTAAGELCADFVLLGAAIGSTLRVDAAATAGRSVFRDLAPQTRRAPVRIDLRRPDISVAEDLPERPEAPAAS